MNPNKCYFRYIDKEDIVNITFLLKVKNSVRQFNFNRTPSENVESLYAKISATVQKAHEPRNNGKKKNKARRKKKNNVAAILEENSSMGVIEVKMFDVTNEPIALATTCQDLFKMQGPIKLWVSGHEYEAVFNVPWVVSMKLPGSITKGCPVCPVKLMTQHTIKDNTTFHWYRGGLFDDKGNKIRDIDIRWSFIASSYSYTPTAEDVGMKLKLVCIPGNKKGPGPAVEAVSNSAVEARPDHFPFENRHVFTQSKANKRSVRCVSYNILADFYCDRNVSRTESFPYCQPWALHIDYRKQLVLEELVGYNADIICLQEVDRKIFNSHLKTNLHLEGFEGVFHKKGSEITEGLACFFRKQKFWLRHEEKILLNKALKTEQCLRPLWDAVKDNKPLTERLLRIPTIASAILLQARNPNEMVLVGNTHLYSHPDADHIRLLQAGIVVYWLNDLKRDVMREFPDKRVSLIICGDFNSAPSYGIYQLYTTGVAPSHLPDWYSNETEAIKNLSLQLGTSLASACGTPRYTNFTVDFADCVDYIFYETKNLEVAQVIPMPSEEELREHTALPSVVIPSDHVALVTDLRFKPYRGPKPPKYTWNSRYQPNKTSLAR